MAESNPATGQDVHITHVFDAPRELVFKAWIDPDQVVLWWSPESMDVPRDRVEIDPRPGGRYDLVMVSPGGGAEHPLRAEIVEIVEPELLVIKTAPMPEAGVTNEVFTRVEFHEEGGKTRMELTDGPYPGDFCELAERGRREAIGKLDRLLAG